MGIFGNIMSAIFGQPAKAETPAAGTAAPSASTAPQASPAPSGTVTRTGPAPVGPKVEWSEPVDVAAALRGRRSTALVLGVSASSLRSMHGPCLGTLLLMS